MLYKPAQRKKLFRRLFWRGILFVVLVLIVYSIYAGIKSRIPQGEDLSVAVPVMGADHISVGSYEGTYNSNPPTSGPHYEQTARSGFREDTITDGHLIHNLEHGDIWVSYHPRIKEDAKMALKKFAGLKVVITPREENDTDIALAAWGRLDSFNLENGVVPEQRIRDFINRYINHGPERVTGASGGI